MTSDKMLYWGTSGLGYNEVYTYSKYFTEVVSQYYVRFSCTLYTDPRWLSNGRAVTSKKQNTDD